MEEASGPPVELWPDNAQSVNVFMAMSTQWRMGPIGPSGLDYNVLPEVWRRLKVAPVDRDQVFQDLMAMEDEALRVMREKKD